MAALADTQSPSPDARAPGTYNAGVFARVQPGPSHLSHPAGDEMAGDGSRKGLRGPYLCRRFLRFLVWFKADLDIFRSLEETSSESEKRAERQGAEWGVRSAAPKNH